MRTRYCKAAYHTNAGNKYLLTFQDNLTKFSKAMPIPNQEATTVAKKLTKIILEYEIPEQILINQGTNFMSEMFKNVCKLLRIEKIQTTAYHPESNRALECYNENMLANTNKANAAATNRRYMPGRSRKISTSNKYNHIRLNK